MGFETAAGVALLAGTLANVGGQVFSGVQTASAQDDAKKLLGQQAAEKNALLADLERKKKDQALISEKTILRDQQREAQRTKKRQKGGRTGTILVSPFESIGTLSGKGKTLIGT